MNLMVAVDMNWGIGREGKLLFHLSQDMKRFRKHTEGCTVIYGRKTLETFPGGRPLVKRKNIVMSRQEDYAVEGATVCHSLSHLGRLLGPRPTESIWVIGGESIYRSLLPYCSDAFVTHVWHTFAADAFFPNLADCSDWQPHETLPTMQGINKLAPEPQVLDFSFHRYRQKKTLSLEQLMTYDDR